jgi:hypothetical protein
MSQVCATLQSGDKGSDKWYGESTMDKTTDITPNCYNATYKNDYVHHDYFFTVALCNNNKPGDIWNPLFVNVNTPHGKNDRPFKINFNNANGDQVISALRRPDEESCVAWTKMTVGDLAHITVQEKNKKGEESGQKCYLGIFCI